MRPLFVSFAPVLSLVAASAFAQVPPAGTPLPGERDLIRDRQERLLEEQRRRLEELQQLPDRDISAPEPIPDDERCFDIQTIRLKGATLVSALQQAALVQPFEGKCLGAHQLNALLKAITQFYIGRGYVTSRAYLPQLDMADGELEVMVVAGLDQSAVGRNQPSP